MTNTEAIAILRRIQEPEAWEPQINEAAYEALEMAISALEGKDTDVPSKDIVYRQDVEDMLQNALPSRGMWEIEGDVVKNAICETVADLMMDLEKLPSADSVSKKDVLGWLLAYHTKSFDLKGRYYPHEVIGWLVADISKNLFADMRGEQDE